MSNNLKDVLIDDEDLIILETAINFFKTCLDDYESYQFSKRDLIEIMQDAECHLYDNGIRLTAKKVETICKKINHDTTWVETL